MALHPRSAGAAAACTDPRRDRHDRDLGVDAGAARQDRAVGDPDALDAAQAAFGIDGMARGVGAGRRGSAGVEGREAEAAHVESLDRARRARLRSAPAVRRRLARPRSPRRRASPGPSPRSRSPGAVVGPGEAVGDDRARGCRRPCRRARRRSSRRASPCWRRARAGRAGACRSRAPRPLPCPAGSRWPRSGRRRSRAAPRSRRSASRRARATTSSAKLAVMPVAGWIERLRPRRGWRPRPLRRSNGGVGTAPAATTTNGAEIRTLAAVAAAAERRRVALAVLVQHPLDVQPGDDPRPRLAGLGSALRWTPPLALLGQPIAHWQAPRQPGALRRSGALLPVECRGALEREFAVAAQHLHRRRGDADRRFDVGHPRGRAAPARPGRGRVPRARRWRPRPAGGSRCRS